MLSYPIDLEDDDETVLATSPDFPELTTFGDDRGEALDRAVDALEEAIAARIHTGQRIPRPSDGKHRAVLPTLTAIKVILYQGMKDEGIGKAELARRLGWHLPASGPRSRRAPPLPTRPDGRRVACDRAATGGERPRRRLAEGVAGSAIAATSRHSIPPATGHETACRLCRAGGTRPIDQGWSRHNVILLIHIDNRPLRTTRPGVGVLRRGTIGPGEDDARHDCSTTA